MKQSQWWKGETGKEQGQVGQQCLLLMTRWYVAAIAPRLTSLTGPHPLALALRSLQLRLKTHMLAHILLLLALILLRTEPQTPSTDAWTPSAGPHSESTERQADGISSHSTGLRSLSGPLPCYNKEN